MESLEKSLLIMEAHMAQKASTADSIDGVDEEGLNILGPTFIARPLMVK
jgi:hypothetical protein